LADGSNPSRGATSLHVHDLAKAGQSGLPRRLISLTLWWMGARGLVVRMAAFRITLLGAAAAAAIGAFAPPARAQAGIRTVLELDGAPVALSSMEMGRLTALGTAISGGRRGPQDAALAAARSAVSSPAGRQMLARYELELGGRRGDNAMRARALDELIASPLTPRARLAGHLAVRGDVAYQLGDLETAGRVWARLLEIDPNDADILSNLAQVRQAQNDATGAAALLERAIAARAATAQPVSEIWYRQRMSVAYQGRLVRPTIAAAQSLVTTFPTARNWRDALVVYRQLVAPQDGFEIDLLRLMRAVGAFARASEYQRLAQLLTRAGAAAEAKAVLDDGLARGHLNARESPTREIIVEVDRAIPRDRSRLDAMRAQAPAGDLSLADSLAGSGRQAEAAARYRDALQRPGVNAAEVNIRLGMALLLAGERAQAEAAFRQATTDAAAIAQPGRYADLAQFWLAWLAQPPASASVAPRNS
jgi:tetratricopeptide (TPR) repeat protein